MALFEALARQLLGLPVIIMTAHGTVPDAVTATRRGVFGFLPKPFETQLLLAEIERGARLLSSSLAIRRWKRYSTKRARWPPPMRVC
jgi:two-component system response regulator GlrR